MAVSPSAATRRRDRLEPGDRIVLVVTAAASRGPALAACEFLIDWLKTKAPSGSSRRRQRASSGSTRGRAMARRLRGGGSRRGGVHASDSYI